MKIADEIQNIDDSSAIDPRNGEFYATDSSCDWIRARSLAALQRKIDTAKRVLGRDFNRVYRQVGNAPDGYGQPI